MNLAQARAQLPPSPFGQPEDIIASAADVSVLDRLQRLADEAMRRLAEGKGQLPERRRSQIRRTVAMLRAQLGEG